MVVSAFFVTISCYRVTCSGIHEKSIYFYSMARVVIVLLRIP